MTQHRLAAVRENSLGAKQLQSAWVIRTPNADSANRPFFPSRTNCDRHRLPANPLADFTLLHFFFARFFAIDADGKSTYCFVSAFFGRGLGLSVLVGPLPLY